MSDYFTWINSLITVSYTDINSISVFIRIQRTINLMLAIIAPTLTTKQTDLPTRANLMPPTSQRIDINRILHILTFFNLFSYKNLTRSISSCGHCEPNASASNSSLSETRQKTRPPVNPFGYRQNLPLCINVQYIQILVNLL